MRSALQLGQHSGQGWAQVELLLAALVLSSAIGLERELRQKSAGLRTHTLVGLGAALFMLVSKYGFTDVLVAGRVTLDPSRVAAQVVTGIGFIGGGLIFVRRDAVRGLTTAAVVWVTAAIGAACGAGLPVVASVVTAAHFLIVYGYPPLIRRIPRSHSAMSFVRITYIDGRGVLRQALSGATGRGFAIEELATQRSDSASENNGSKHDGNALGSDRVDLDTGTTHTVDVLLKLRGTDSIDGLVASLTDLDGVIAVIAGGSDDTSD